MVQKHEAEQSQKIRKLEFQLTKLGDKCTVPDRA